MTSIRYPRRARIGAFTAANWTLTAAGLLTIVSLPDLELLAGDEAVLEIRAGTFRLDWTALPGAVSAGATFQINELLASPPTEGAPVRTWIRLRVGRKVGLASDQKIVTFDYTTGSPAPVVSGVFASAIGTTTATANWTVSQASGTSYVYVSANASETVSTVKTSGASQAVSAAGAQTRSLTGLTAATSYYLHVVFNDGTSDSTVTSAAFTTQAVSPPPDGDADVTVGTYQALLNAVNAYAASDMGGAKIIDVVAGDLNQKLTLANKTFSHMLTIRSASGFASPAIFTAFDLSNVTNLTLQEIKTDTGANNVTDCTSVVILGCELWQDYSDTSNSTLLDVQSCASTHVRHCCFRHGGAQSIGFYNCTNCDVEFNAFEKTTNDCMKINNCTGCEFRWNVGGIEIERQPGDVPHWDFMQMQHVNNNCLWEYNILFNTNNGARSMQGLFNKRRDVQAVGKVSGNNIYRQNLIITNSQNGIYLEDEIGGSSTITVEFNTMIASPSGQPNQNFPKYTTGDPSGYTGVTNSRNMLIHPADAGSADAGTGGEIWKVAGTTKAGGLTSGMGSRLEGPTWTATDELSHWRPIQGASEPMSYQHATPIGCHDLWNELLNTGYPYLHAAEAAWNRTLNADSFFSAA